MQNSPSVMDFYLAAIRFLTNLAVNAKSCLNNNTLFLQPKTVSTYNLNFISFSQESQPHL